MKILITGRLPGSVVADIETSHEIDMHSHDHPMSREQLLGRIGGKDGLLCTITDTVDTDCLRTKRAGSMRITGEWTLCSPTRILYLCMSRLMNRPGTSSMPTPSTA